MSSQESKEGCTIELYATPACPFARRGMIAAAEKGLKVTNFTIPLKGQIARLQANGLDAVSSAKAYWPGKTAEEIVKIKEDYKRDINATGEVPTVVIRHPDGSADIITEADVASEFLDDYAPDSGVSLMPSDPVARARVRQWIKILNGPNGVTAQYKCLMNQDPANDTERRAAVHKGMASFVSLANPDGPYFLGDQYSLADLLLQPMWDQFRFTLPHYRGVEMIPTADQAAEYPWAPRMHAWATAIEQREVFKAIRMDKSAYITGYIGYAGERGVAKFGQ